MTFENLIKEGIVSLALLPEKNDYLLTEEGIKLRNKILEEEPEKLGELVKVKFHNLPFEEKQKYLDITRLEKLVAYTIPLISHDYAAKTPLMWNNLYEAYNLNLKNIMIVANPKNTELILKSLKDDPKYIGGGAGVGFKETCMPYLDKINGDFKSINIIYKKEGELLGDNTDSKGLIKSLEEKLNCVDRSIKGSNFIIVGAGGVAKDVSMLLAENEANYISIVNRTITKAVSLANELNQKFQKSLSIGVGENMTRGVLLNSEIKPDAIINLSDKGSDSLPTFSMFYKTSSENEYISRDMIRMAKELTPELIYVDIVLPSSGESISLRIARSEGIGDKYILNGKPMVIYQAAPAYLLVQNSNQELHTNLVTEDEALKIFKKSAN